ncbi:helix-turn-helix domain-containing protein [Myxosarcina sp. GI1]|nr:helix-turn-helix domain-containing protein [Myxosarcina sp. GI1]
MTKQCQLDVKKILYRVVNAVENGMSKAEAARVFGVSRTEVHH